MVVGDNVMMTPTTMVDELNRMVKDKVPGTVVYIHPQGRWYTVLFDAGFRESFWTDLPKTKETVPHTGYHRI